MRALLPAALVALFAGWCGTFYYGAAAPAVVVAHLVLLLVAAWGWRGWDPLRLGQRGRALPPLLWTVAVLALRASPVPRAGWVAVALLPALLALPAAVARCWETPPARLLGVRAVAVVTSMTGAVALVAMAWQHSLRAAQPLGQALVLAELLAPLLPLVVLVGFGAAAPATRGGRWAARAGAVAAVGGLIATRSIAALAALGVGLFLALPRRRRRWLALPIVLGLLLLAPRLVRVARGEDSSLLARGAYWEAGLDGVARRPWLGWGPGATAWTLAPMVRPVPGENPPGEVIGDLHGLVLQLPFELGVPALVVVIALGVAFVRRRLAALDADAELRRAGLAGLAAGVTSLLGGPTLGTLAPWVALAVAAGAALAAAPQMPVAGETPRPAARAGWLYAAVALLLLLPLDGALVCYDLARMAEPARARALLALAVELDPELPLYHARLGWLAPTAEARARELELAAQGAPGVGALQLAAGWSAAAAGRSSAAPLLRQACAADPLSGVAPFLLATSAPGSAAAPTLGARALLTDPTLLAAVDWERMPELRAAAVAEAQHWPGIDAGYREGLAWLAASLPAGGAIGRLRVVADDAPATAMSLYAFRRLPWPVTLASVPVRAPAAARIGLFPAGTLRSSSREAFPADCARRP